MPRYEINSKITILKKERTIESILLPLTNYPASNVVAFFQEIGLSFPRELRISVLRDVLRTPVLNVREERASLADEMNYRLSWFNQMTEVQLVNLFSFFKDTKLESFYLERLWLSIIEYITDKKISENDFDRLIKLSEEHAKKSGIKLPDVVVYNNDLNPLFFDQKNKIDGLKQDTIRPVLYKSSTITEIRELGKKYGVDVPKRLKKSELIDIIVKELKERNEYSAEKEEELNRMNILLIQRFAINNKIKASTELKKEEVIEYILSNAEGTREAYFVPSASVYEVEAHELGEVMPEVVVHEPVVEEEPAVVEEPVAEPVEEVVEEIVEEKVVEEPVQTEQLKVDDETLQRLLAMNVVTHQEPVERKFNPDSVDETHLNVIEYYGKKKPKKYVNELNDEESAILVTEQAGMVDNQVYHVEVVGIKDEKPKKSFGKIFFNVLLKILLIILIVAATLFVIASIYVYITSDGAPAAMQSIEDFINGIFNWNALEKLRELVIKVFKLT